MKRRVQGRKTITVNVDGSIICEKDSGIWGKYIRKVIDECRK